MLDRMSTQAQRAEAFAALHRSGVPLLLPNAWDAGSAAVIASGGAAAIATTSAGVAWSLGLADGGGLGGERCAAVVERVVAVVDDLPVSADVEDGYGTEPAAVAATVTAVVRAGAVGLNIEDRPGRNGATLYTPAEQAERIAAARAVARRLGVPFWINARTDTYLAAVGPEERRLAETLERADAYAAAGADSLFVPGVADLDTIAELVAGPLPLNVMAWAGMPSVTELAGVGVCRISLGSAVAQAAYALAARATEELLVAGTYDTTAAGLAYVDLNALLSGVPGVSGVSGVSSVSDLSAETRP
jgi:2-methylisocitrate lyase-like PEP mutase family enzyme